MYKKNRIGLDIDDKEQGKLLLRYFRILGLKGYYRQSSSKRGFHFYIILKKECNKKDNLNIRYMLGDCYGRYKADVRRFQHGLKEFDILFYKKKNKLASKWKKI